MAGPTYRWINNNEYRRVKRKQQSARERRRTADRKIAEAEERLRKVEEALRDVKAGGGGPGTAAELNAFEEQFNDLETALRTAVGEQNVRFRAELDAIRGEMDGVTQDLDEVRLRIGEAERTFQQRFFELARAQEVREDRARLFLGQLRTGIAAIRELHPEKLTPGELGILETAAADVERDLRNGDHEAAIGVAQTRIPEAVSLEARLAVLNERYEQLVIELHERADAALERIRQVQDPNRMAVTEDCVRRETASPGSGPLNQNPALAFDGRVSFWSGGLLEEIVRDFDELLRRVSEDYEPAMDLEALERALQDVQEVDHRLDRCVACAHRESEEAGYVELLVESLYEALVPQDVWSVVSSGYDSGDERLPFNLTLVNGNGDLACFVVVPRRRELGRTRTGIRYGDSEFILRVFDGAASRPAEGSGPAAEGRTPEQTRAEVRDEAYCEVVRDAILARLGADGITSAVAGRTGRPEAQFEEGFFATQNDYGRGIRQERILTERRQLGLTG